MEMIEIPDATLEPERYKQALLELLGGRDPLQIMAETIPAIRDRCEDVPEARLRSTPEPGEWSAADVVTHLFQVDIVYGFRWRLVLTQDNPTYPGYNEKAWTPLPQLPFWQTVSAWEGLRAANLTVLHGVPPAVWSNVGVHEEQGTETFDEMVRKLAAHDLAHVNQVERTLAATADAPPTNGNEEDHP